MTGLMARGRAMRCGRGFGACLASGSWGRKLLACAAVELLQAEGAGQEAGGRRFGLAGAKAGAARGQRALVAAGASGGRKAGVWCSANSRRLQVRVAGGWVGPGDHARMDGLQRR
jgi:hypothetical protein